MRSGWVGREGRQMKEIKEKEKSEQKLYCNLISETAASVKPQ